MRSSKLIMKLSKRERRTAVKNARLARFALIVLVCLNVSSAHAQSGLLMTIQTRSTTFEVGKPMLMQITYVNCAQEIVWVSKSAIPTVRSGIVVTTKDGERLKGNHETANPARLDRMGFGLHPGETTRESIDIARIYDLTQPGSYTVFVEKVYAPGGHHVKSTAITFTIVK
jgi:hypothetical protein